MDVGSIMFTRHPSFCCQVKGTAPLDVGRCPSVAWHRPAVLVDILEMRLDEDVDSDGDLKTGQPFEQEAPRW